MKRFFILGSALAFLGAAAPAVAQTPPPPSVEKATDRTFDGRVEEYLPPTQGMSGMLLDTGVIVHFPKAKEDDVQGLANVGSDVRVAGVPHMGPNKKYIVEAMKITNLDNGGSMTFAPPPPPPRAPR